MYQDTHGTKSGTKPDPSLEEQVTVFHSAQLKLCEQLEKIADSLPDCHDCQAVLSVSRQIYPIVRAAHVFEEEVLFPQLLEDENGTVANSIERLRFEHWEDESSAEDLSEFLRQLVQQPEKTNVGKLSYMLRGFFEGLRRHIAFETEHLLPKLRQMQ